MRIETASAKARTGGPGDAQSVRPSLYTPEYAQAEAKYSQQDIANEQLAQHVWAGVIPVNVAHGKPQPAGYNKAKPPRDYWM